MTAPSGKPQEGGSRGDNLSVEEPLHALRVGPGGNAKRETLQLVGNTRIESDMEAWCRAFEAKGSLLRRDRSAGLVIGVGLGTKGSWKRAVGW